MARNIEVKARVDDLDAVARRVAPLATHGPEAITQDDTFFHAQNGRLKLRVFGDGSGELIAYDRGDTTGPKTSDYVRCPVPDPALLREALARSCGQRGRVRKQRTLYRVGPTRVHLDVVEGLGSFVELEVVLAADQTADEGAAVARSLLTALGIGEHQLLAGAYIDLIDELADELAEPQEPSPR